MTAYAFYLQMVRVQHASRNPRQQVGRISSQYKLTLSEV